MKYKKTNDGKIIRGSEIEYIKEMARLLALRADTERQISELSTANNSQ